MAPDVQSRAGYSICGASWGRSSVSALWAISSGATQCWQMWEICCRPDTSAFTSSSHCSPQTVWHRRDLFGRLKEQSSLEEVICLSLLKVRAEVKAEFKVFFCYAKIGWEKVQLRMETQGKSAHVVCSATASNLNRFTWLLKAGIFLLFLEVNSSVLPQQVSPVRNVWLSKRSPVVLTNPEEKMSNVKCNCASPTVKATCP